MVPRSQHLSTELLRLMDKFQKLFEEPQSLPPRRGCDHQIPLQDGAKPVCIRPYSHPCHLKNEIEKQIIDLLAVGLIRDNTSHYASLVILVKKADGSWRMCIDYRALNQQTIKAKFPIPVIDELLDELGGSQYFSKLDLRSGYHQIRMVAAHIPYPSIQKSSWAVRISSYAIWSN